VDPTLVAVLDVGDEMGEELDAGPQLVVAAEAGVDGALVEDEAGVELGEPPLGDRWTREVLEDRGEGGVIAGGDGSLGVDRAPECCQERSSSARSSSMVPRRRKASRTASRKGSSRARSRAVASSAGIGWKRPSRSKTPAETRAWTWGWKVSRLPKLCGAAMKAGTGRSRWGKRRAKSSRTLA